MMRTASFAGAVSMLSLIGPAHAQLFSPPLWTDVGNAGACYVRNIGTTPFQVRVKLFSNNALDGTIVDVDTCNTGPLGAGKTCVIFSLHLPDASWAACSARASGSNVSKLRANIDIRHFVTGGAKVVIDEDLR
jgi:hypothetical protein